MSERCLKSRKFCSSSCGVANFIGHLLEFAFSLTGSHVKHVCRSSSSVRRGIAVRREPPNLEWYGSTQHCAIFPRIEVSCNTAPKNSEKMTSEDAVGRSWQAGRSTSTLLQYLKTIGRRTLAWTKHALTLHCSDIHYWIQKLFFKRKQLPNIY